MDANVLLSYVNGTVERLEEIESILDASRRGDLAIVTSVLSITEVAFGAEEQRQSILSPEIEDDINQLWTPGSPVTLIEVHELIAEEARSLVWAGVGRKPLSEAGRCDPPGERSARGGG